MRVLSQKFHCSSWNCYHGCFSGCDCPTYLKLEDERHLSPSKRALLDGSVNTTPNGRLGKVDDGVHDGRLDCGMGEEGRIGIGEGEDGMLGDGTGEELSAGDAVNAKGETTGYGRDEKKPVAEDNGDDKGSSSNASDASHVDDERSNDGSMVDVRAEDAGNEEGTSSGSARVLKGILKKSSQLGESSSHSVSNSKSSHLRECPSASGSMNKRVKWMPTEQLVQVHQLQHSSVDGNHELRKCGVCIIL